MKTVRKAKNLFILCMMICLLCSTSVMASAEEASSGYAPPDYNRKGSITVNIVSTENQRAVSGGELTLYKVAFAAAVDGNNVFRLTGAFAQSGADIDDISENDQGARETASTLENYAVKNNIEGVSASVNKNGQAVWDDLELGLYLVVDTAPADGYAPVNAFLITVPRLSEGSYIYDVQAGPKVDTADSVTDGTPAPNTKAPSSGGSLPQTGQLWWPVPVLAAAGILSIILGLYRRSCGSSERRRCGSENR